jgi:hypothetical protein
VLRRPEFASSSQSGTNAGHSRDISQFVTVSYLRTIIIDTELVGRVGTCCLNGFTSPDQRTFIFIRGVLGFP